MIAESVAAAALVASVESVGAVVRLLLADTTADPAADATAGLAAVAQVASALDSAAGIVAAAGSAAAAVQVASAVSVADTNAGSVGVVMRPLVADMTAKSVAVKVQALAAGMGKLVTPVGSQGSVDAATDRAEHPASSSCVSSFSLAGRLLSRAWLKARAHQRVAGCLISGVSPSR
jgi:hypothetical protein